MAFIFKINILFWPVLLLAYLFADIKQVVFMYCMAFLHEMGHLFSAKKLGYKIKNITVLPFGITVKLKNMLFDDWKEEILVAASGPFVNVILALFFYIIKKSYQLDLDFYIIANLCMAIINLVPIMPMDGGRIFTGFLSSKLGEARAFKFSMSLSKVLIYIMLILGVVFLRKTGYNFSIATICMFLFCNMFFEQGKYNMNIMKQIINRLKITDSFMIKTKYFLTDGETKAINVLKYFSTGKLCVIGVLNKNMTIVGNLTENEIINAMIEKDCNIKLIDIYQLSKEARERR